MNTIQPKQGISVASGALPMKYCLYARKSSEQDERQALSIESQIKEMVQMAIRDGVTVTEIRQESHSAKDSGQRPVFNKIIEDIKQGTFDGILAWDPSRISRNAGDLGRVVDLIDQGYIKEIRTHGQRFTNSPNEKFLLMILCSQAKLENDHKGENVKRGLRAKCAMGWRPGMPPLGYFYDPSCRKGEKKIIIDPDRAPIMKQMFERVAYQGQSGRDILQWMDEIGFKTRSGCKMALSRIYLILRDHFYYGRFEYPLGSGIFYDGKHQPIIDKDLFDKVQACLIHAPRLRPGTKEFNFVKIFKCGKCGSGVTASEKFKRLKNGGVNKYIYYHCTKFRDRYCNEKYIREDNLIGLLLQLFDNIPVNKIRISEKLNREVERHRKFVNGILGQEVAEAQTNQVNIRNYAKYILQEGTKEEKREIISCLDATIFIKDSQIYLKEK
ncbi:MAG: recombinase family protein [Candidatus Sungbacteria bacterium]|nr:recombinase family protein [Candidatus Sungbacteria bacterium]